jgi:hypothetical protein
VFHFTALNFWNNLECARCRPDSNSQLGGDLPDAEPLCPELVHPIAIKDPLGPMRWEVLPGTTADGLPHAPGPVILKVTRPTCLGALPN